MHIKTKLEKKEKTHKKIKNNFIIGGVLVAGLVGAMFYNTGAGVQASLFDALGFDIFEQGQKSDQALTLSVSETENRTPKAAKETIFENVRMHVMGLADAQFFRLDAQNLESEGLSESQQKTFNFQTYKEFSFAGRVFDPQKKPLTGALLRFENNEGHVILDVSTDAEGYYAANNISLPAHFKQLRIRVAYAIETESLETVYSAQGVVKLNPSNQKQIAIMYFLPS